MRPSFATVDARAGIFFTSLFSSRMVYYAWANPVQSNTVRCEPGYPGWRSPDCTNSVWQIQESRVAVLSGNRVVSCSFRFSSGSACSGTACNSFLVSPKHWVMFSASSSHPISAKRASRAKRADCPTAAPGQTANPERHSRVTNDAYCSDRLAWRSLSASDVRR